jgi:membrane protein implicated in regulation of membrane protease activity
MESYVIWIVVGFVLVAVELTTGTFYLLVLGSAAFAGALAAYLGVDYSVQAIIASVVGVVGVFLVNHWRRSHKDLAPGSNNIDLGQSVIFESWSNEAARFARVRYRGASWDVHVVGEAPAKANDALYICGSEGGQFQVSPTKINIEKGKP